MDLEEEKSPRETFIESQHVLSTLDWTDVLQQPHDMLNSLQLFDKHMTEMLQVLPKINTKKRSRFICDAIRVLNRPTSALQRLRLYLSAEPESLVAKAYKEDPGLLMTIEERILNHVDMLIASTVAQWNGRQKFDLRLDPKDENELNNQHYLLVYILLRILDQWVAPEPMDAAIAYFERTHPRYNVKRPPAASAMSGSPSQDRATITAAKDRVLSHLTRAMDFARKCHLSIESLLVWKPTPVFTTGVNDEDDSFDEDALIEDNFPLSETGICVLVAGMIYSTCCATAGINSPYMLPMTLAQDWVFTKAGGLASGFLTSEESQFQLADKALLVLLYAIDRIPEDKMPMEMMDECTMDSSTDRMGLFQIFQVMVNFAATCSSSQHRFLTFQAIDRLIRGSQEEVKLYCLEQLVSSKCPYETMRAASVNLLKGCVERAFQQYEEAKEVEDQIRHGRPSASGPQSQWSVFVSPMLLKIFHAHLWRVDGNAFARDPLDDEDKWEEQYDTFMHSLNFYLYLLMRDTEEGNLTEVWLTSNVRETHNKFIALLTKRAEALHAAYQSEISKKQGTQETLVETAADAHLPPHTVKESKNGVLEVDIDYETSGDEEMEEVVVGNELVQKQLRVELIQEVLSNIVQKTQHLL
ncbi:hypothetical protein BGW41_002296 [Actinomortierella wolfii]|nr:hypothetical protein BGW41_002296 [Actinomortierella wolfii]